MDNCTLDCIQIMGNFSREDTCSFVTDNCIQDTVQVVQGYYCLANGSFVMLLIVSIIVLLLTYYALNIATDDYLAPCLEEFIVKLNMSQALAGITFLALANGAPDILTAVVAGTSSSDTTVLIPFGSLYGAALFSMGFILTMVIYYSPDNKLTLNLRESLVPLGFYMAGTVYLVAVSIFYQKMNITLALIFFCFYLIYIAFVVYEERKKKIKEKQRKQKSLLSESQGSASEEETMKAIHRPQMSEKKEDESKEKREEEGKGKEEEKGEGEGKEEEKGEGEVKEEGKGEGEGKEKKKKKKRKMTMGEEMDEVYQEIHREEEEEDNIQKDKPVGRFKHYARILWCFIYNYSVPLILKDQVNTRQLLISLIFSPLVLWLAKGIPDTFQTDFLGMNQAIWLSLPSIVLLAYLLFCLLRNKTPYWVTIYNIYSFVVIVSWISLVVGVLINLMELLQLLTNVNSVFLGLTVFAWANSIGDYLSITTFAKRSYSSTAVSGVFSGQLLNFLIGFGIALILNTISQGQYDFQIFDLSGDTYTKLSDLIVIVVIGLAFGYMVLIFIVLVMKKGELTLGLSWAGKIYYFVFIVIALIISVLTDFYNEFVCDL